MLFLALLWHAPAAWAQCSDPGYQDGNLNTCTTGYLGATGQDEGTSIRILGNGDIVVAGKFHGIPSPQNSYNYLAASANSTGMVLIFSPDGSQLKAAARLGDQVDDMDVDRERDQIVAYGSFGLAKLNADGSQLVWSKTQSPVGTVAAPAIYSTGRRVSVGQNGDIVVLGNTGSASASDGFALLFDHQGNPIGGTMSLPRSGIGGGTYNEKWEDIALDSQGKRIFVTGTMQRCSSYQSSFLVAYSYASENFGSELWQSFSLWCSGADEQNLEADARGKRVEFANGELLFVGHADGGNNLFTRKANDFETSEPNLVAIDRWNNGAGFGSGKIGFFARLNPQDGTVIKSQFQFSSTGVNQARSFEILAIGAQEDGQVLIGGISNKDMPNRANLQINGTPLGARVDDEACLIGVRQDFALRSLVAGFTGTQSPSTSAITALDAHNGKVAVLGKTQGGIITHSPLDGSFSSDQDVFLSIFNQTSLVTGIADPEASEPAIFPNPVQGTAEARLPLHWQGPGARLSILALDGRLVAQHTLQGTASQPLPALPSGFYLARFEQGGRTAYQKLVVP